MTGDPLEGLLARLTEDDALLLDSEEATKQGVILPILSRLGWDRDDVREVVPEYRVENGRVDYCLRLGQRSAVFIEAKRTDQDLERHQEQLLDYAFREGVDLAVLTNGIVWWLYLPLLQGSWEQRKFLTVDIAEQKPATAAGHFHQYLARRNVESGAASRDARALHQSREKERLTRKTLPRAWRLLCDGPDELLVELLAEKTESVCGHRPFSEQVAEFLQGVNHPPARPGEAGEPPRGAMASPGPVGGRAAAAGSGYTFRRPKRYTLVGEARDVSTWKEVLVGVCEEMFEHQPGEFERVLQVRGRKRPYFARDPQSMTSPIEIPGSGIFVETNLSANDTVKRCHQVLRLFGYRPGDFSVETE